VRMEGQTLPTGKEETGLPGRLGKVQQKAPSEKEGKRYLAALGHGGDCPDLYLPGRKSPVLGGLNGGNACCNRCKRDIYRP